jgi:hypothetical protein
MHAWQESQEFTCPRSTIRRNSVPGCRRVMNVSRCLRENRVLNFVATQAVGM